MRTPPPEPPSSGLNVNEILFILFKHKWKIIISSVAGLAAAAAVFFLYPPSYESQAKILVRYVVDTSSVDTLDARGMGAAALNDSIINTEVEILTSRDLANDVAKAAEAAGLLPAGSRKPSEFDAVRSIITGLSVLPTKGSKVIYVSYKNRDPAVATSVLTKLIDKYLEMHLEVHRSTGGSKYLELQMEPIKRRLERTEKELKEKKDAANVVSLTESMNSLGTRMAKGQEDLAAALAEQAGQRARLQDMQRSLTGTGGNASETTPSPVNSEDVQRYRELVVHLNDLRKGLMDLLSRYNPEARVVKVSEAQIEDLDKQRRELEKKYPSLAATAPAPVAGSPQAPQPDLITERAHLAAIDARIEVLKAQSNDTHQAFVLFSDASAQIAQLERSKQMDEETLKNFELSLQRARIDDARKWLQRALKIGDRERIKRMALKDADLPVRERAAPQVQEALPDAYPCPTPQPLNAAEFHDVGAAIPIHIQRCSRGSGIGTRRL